MYILMLLVCLNLGLPSGLFRFPVKTQYEFFLSLMHAVWPTHLIIFDMSTQITFSEEYKSWNLSLWNFMHPLCTSTWAQISFPAPFFTNTLGLCYSLNLRDHISHQGTAVAQWLGCCATNQKVTGSIPDGVIGIFHWHKILPIALWPWGRLSL